MTGTEKIIQHIKDDTDAQIREIREAARAEAEFLLNEAECSCRELLKNGAEKAAAVKGDLTDKKQLSLAMENRQALLAARGELISDVLSSAKEKLLNEDKEQYFAFLYRQLEKQETVGCGVLQLNAADLARRPADFDARVAAIAAGKKGSLTVSAEPAAISGGFLLNYGGTVENCSVEALFASEEEILKDTVRQILFAENA